MTTTACKLCGQSFVCNNGMWFTTCTCAKDRPAELKAAQDESDRLCALTPPSKQPLTPAALAKGRRLLEKREELAKALAYRHWMWDHAHALLDAAERAEKAEAELVRLREDRNQLWHTLYDAVHGGCTWKTGESYNEAFRVLHTIPAPEEPSNG